MKFGVQVYNKIRNLCASVVKILLVKKKLFEKKCEKIPIIEMDCKLGIDIGRQILLNDA
jgi:hypothetical protein